MKRKQFPVPIPFIEIPAAFMEETKYKYTKRCTRIKSEYLDQNMYQNRVLHTENYIIITHEYR